MKEHIAVVFDFDDTLAPDSTSGLLERLGVDVPRFWKETVQPLIDDDWDPVPAYLREMIRLSDSGALSGGAITRDTLANWGAALPLHPGAASIFDRLKAHVENINPRLNLEFYLISSGIGEVLRHTPIAAKFKDIWASDFSYRPDGSIDFPRKVVSFTDKTRYLFQIQKGLFGKASRGKPFDVNRKFGPEQIRIPFTQMIVVGDGYTDIPCFSMVRKNGGVALGVYDRAHRDKWGRAWGFIEDGRVSNLIPADFAEGAAFDYLVMAVESIARRVEVERVTFQG